MELETVNKLYLELSQFTTATTARELQLEAENERLRDALLDIKNGKDNPCYLADKAMRGEKP